MNNMIAENTQYELSDSDFDVISKIAYENFALNLDLSKKSMVVRRLTPRTRELGLSSLEEYAKLLSESDVEQATLVTSLTTNLTHFFREQHHFDLMKEKWLPRLVDTAKRGGRVRLWSSACSSGQEPYSLAIEFLESCPEAAELDIKILATDIDPQILQRAEAGAYHEEEVDGLNAAIRQKYFTAPTTSGEPFFVKKEVKKLISFGALNLPADWPFNGKFDIVFCRNVAIYFDRPTQQLLWSRIAERLPEEGLLCIGHSERLSGPAADYMVPLGQTAYMKKTAS